MIIDKIFSLIILLVWSYITFYLLVLVIPGIFVFIFWQEWFTKYPKRLIDKILEK